MRQKMSIYIHIPFCNSKCHYCGFVSSVAGDERKNNYLIALGKELSLRGKEYSSKYEISTIYIGGGTPSCLEIGAIKDIMHNIYNSFTVCNDAEITIEINPNTLTPEKANEYLLCGINRFSIGLQSAEPRLLKILGRTHSFADFERCVGILNNAGAVNISADIMLGLPTQTETDVVNTINKIYSLKCIKHISAYMLSIEPNTNFEKLVSANALKLPSEKQVIKLYNVAYNTLLSFGFQRYEFSNFAMVGYKSKHNLVYWNRQPYLGLGIASHSFVDNERFANISDEFNYCDFISKNQIPLESKDTISVQDAKEEVIMLSLRLTSGLDVNKYLQTFNENILAVKKDEISLLIKDGFLKLDTDNHLSATDKGFLVLNKIIEMLI